MQSVTPTVVKLGVYDGGGNCFGDVKVKIGMDKVESTNVMVAGFRQCRYLIRKGKMFVEYEASVVGVDVGGAAQSLERRSLACGLSLVCGLSMIDI